MKSHYFFQPLIIFVFLFLILVVFYQTAHSTILWAVGAGSLASSAFILFSKPSAVSAHPFHLAFSYIIAILSGVFFHFIAITVLSSGEPYIWMSFFAALSVITCFYAMYYWKLEHPPAAGMALVCVIDLQDIMTLVIIVFAVVVLISTRLLLRSYLRDLF